MKKIIKKLIGKNDEFGGSQEYWEKRYQGGDNSGGGSYGELARFKAEVINGLVKENDLSEVIEFGCGDGAQLELAEYESYLGFDVSKKAVELCRTRHAGDNSKRFELISKFSNQKSDVSLSLDVIYHLVERDVFELHLESVFSSATKMAIIYSSDLDLDSAAHVKHRSFTPWVERTFLNWQLRKRIQNPFPYNEETKTGSRADFFIYVPVGN